MRVAYFRDKIPLSTLLQTMEGLGMVVVFSFSLSLVLLLRLPLSLLCGKLLLPLLPENLGQGVSSVVAVFLGRFLIVEIRFLPLCIRG